MARTQVAARRYSARHSLNSRKLAKRDTWSRTSRFKTSKPRKQAVWPRGKDRQKLDVGQGELLLINICLTISELDAIDKVGVISALGRTADASPTLWRLWWYSDTMFDFE